MTADLWKLIQEYNKKYCSSPWTPEKNLYEFIYNKYQGYDSDNYNDGDALCEDSCATPGASQEEPDFAANTP